MKRMRRLELVQTLAEGDCMATYGEVIILSYVAPDNDAALDKFLHRLADLPRTTKYALLVVLAPGVRPPSDAFKRRLYDAVDRQPTIYLGRALVLRGSGFLAAAQRSMASTIALNANVSFPMRTFNEVGPAAAWIAELLGGG